MAIKLLQPRGRWPHLPPPGPPRAYVPVYTLHDMNQELRKPQPVIICSGCGHDIPAPGGQARIQCRDCGRKMQIVSVSPVGEKGKAG